MLVLARKVDEKIVIGSDVVITVVSVRNGVVRFGIEAPDTVPVHRWEVFEQINAEHRMHTRAHGIRLAEHGG